jgi:hypothetical protein
MLAHLKVGTNAEKLAGGKEEDTPVLKNPL